ncbi:MAG: hypothetical protein QOD52_542, partial [Gaiellaceae bacterium]|nr:hypothetical protein [Gaiellaceae bacterium]
MNLPDLTPRLPGGGHDLTRDELRLLVAEIAGDAAAWEPL